MSKHHFTKYIGEPAPTIAGQEAIAAEFNPPSGIVCIRYRLGKIDSIEEVNTRESLDWWFDHHIGSLRIYQKYGKQYRLTYAK